MSVLSNIGLRSPSVNFLCYMISFVTAALAADLSQVKRSFYQKNINH